MNTYMLQNLPATEGLVRCAHASDEPVVLYDGDDECLVAMRPAVFERILFDTNLLNCHQRETLHL